MDSRVRHAYFCAIICAKIRAAHFNMSDKVVNVPFPVWEGRFCMEYKKGMSHASEC